MAELFHSISAVLHQFPNERKSGQQLHQHGPLPKKFVTLFIAGRLTARTGGFIQRAGG